MRLLTRLLRVGGVELGAGRPVRVQTMGNLPLTEVGANIAQIERCAALGCEIFRLALPDDFLLPFFGEIIAHSPLPVIADIHFHPSLLRKALEAGAAGARINPGNVGSSTDWSETVRLFEDLGAVMRIGVNGGSLNKEALKLHGHTAEALVASAQEWSNRLYDLGFYRFKVSLKSSDVRTTVQAYRLFSKVSDIPLHIGLTEAGPLPEGLIKSSAALGTLLLEGIGDTLRISLTAPPEEEVKAAWELLSSLNLRRRWPEVISCPLCARSSYPFTDLLPKLLPRIKSLSLPIKVAFMGCEVNGPGEAREADIGLAFSKGKAFLFRKGEIVERGDPEPMVERLLQVLEEMARDNS